MAFFFWCHRTLQNQNKTIQNKLNQLWREIAGFPFLIIRYIHEFLYTIGTVKVSISSKRKRSYL